MYKVIKHFIDLHDNDHSYNEGDIFPREGVDVSEERLKELAGSDNKQHTPLLNLWKKIRTIQLVQILQKKHQKPGRRNLRIKYPKIKSRQNRRSV